MAKKTPILTANEPQSLINLDPVAATRSIDTLISEKNDEKDWLEEKITIQFYNIEHPGSKATFGWGPCTDPTMLTIEHGEVIELTRGAVRHIESRQTPIKEYKPDGSGKTKKVLIGYKPRFQCRQVNSRKINL